MKKILVSLLLLVPVFTGCAKVETDITLNDDKSVSVINTLSYDGNIEFDNDKDVKLLRVNYPKFLDKKYDIKSEGSVTVALKDPIRTAGKMHWVIYSDEFLDSDYRFNYLITILKKNTTSNPLICLDDLSLYDSKADLARILGVTVSKINWQLNKEEKFTYKNKTYILIKNY